LSIDTTQIQEYLPLSEIFPAKVKVRSYDSDSQVSTIKELSLSIKSHGLLQPIIVRPLKKGFEIVAGHRRFLACRLLRWKKILAFIKDLSDSESFEVQIIENVQRLSLSCIEEGQAFRLFVNNYGWGGVTHLARKIMKSEQYVSSRLQLLNLPKNIQGHVINGDLTVSHALELLSLSEKEQNTIVDKIIDKNLSVKETRAIKHATGINCSSNIPNCSINKTTGSKQNVKTHEMRMESGDIKDYLLNNYDVGTDTANNPHLLILKKAKLCLKISLYRMDNLIHEYIEMNSNGNPGFNIDDDVSNHLLKFRTTMHSLLDEDIKLTLKLKRRPHSQRSFA
jgi:ParB family transcriptional regulator, chromosome partitioning protein